MHKDDPRECGLTYRSDDPENPYVGPQDTPHPVTKCDFAPVVIGLLLILLLLVVLA